MPSLLTSLGDVMDEPQSIKETAIVQAKANERVKTYSLTQLRGLRKHVQEIIAGLPECTLRSSNKILLDQLEKEIARKEAIVSTESTVDVEAENRRKVHQKEVALMNQTEKEAVQRMFESQAKYKANLEVRAAEKEAYIQDRAQLAPRRVKAVFSRSIHYLFSSVLLIAPTTIYLIYPGRDVTLSLLVIGLILGVFLSIRGYVVGQSWRLKVVSEIQIQQKVEETADQLMSNLRETYKKQQDEEEQRREEEKEKRRKRRAEREQRRQEAERKADEELVRAIEEGEKRRREMSRFGRLPPPSSAFIPSSEVSSRKQPDVVNEEEEKGLEGEGEGVGLDDDEVAEDYGEMVKWLAHTVEYYKKGGKIAGGGEGVVDDEKHRAELGEWV